MIRLPLVAVMLVCRCFEVSLNMIGCSVVLMFGCAIAVVLLLFMLLSVSGGGVKDGGGHEGNGGGISSQLSSCVVFDESLVILDGVSTVVDEGLEFLSQYSGRIFVLLFTEFGLFGKQGRLPDNKFFKLLLLVLGHWQLFFEQIDLELLQIFLLQLS